MDACVHCGMCRCGLAQTLSNAADIGLIAGDESVSSMAIRWRGRLTSQAAWNCGLTASCIGPAPSTRLKDRGEGLMTVQQNRLSRTHVSGAKALRRGLQLKCPRCGEGAIFRGWFAMNDRCPACGRRFNRAPGYLLGSIYFNYGVTAILVVAAYFSLYFSEVLTGRELLWALTAFSIVFPLWFFRYARSLWIAFDERWDPWPNEQEARDEANRN